MRICSKRSLTRRKLAETKENRGLSENGFLDSGDEAEAQIFADLAHFAEEVQIEDQFLIFPASQVVEQLVDNDEETVVGILSVETAPSSLRSRACCL